MSKQVSRLDDEFTNCVAGPFSARDSRGHQHDASSGACVVKLALCDVVLDDTLFSIWIMSFKLMSLSSRIAISQ